MKICYQEKRFHPKSQSLITLCNQVLDEFDDQGYELTLRQLYYQLVARAELEKISANYASVVKRLNGRAR